MTFTLDEQKLYARHLSIKEFGTAGQTALKNAKILVVGAGGLGCPILNYLAAAGVGTLGIVEADTVDVSNLQRQTLFSFSDCGKSKAKAAKNRLEAANPYIDIVIHETWLDESNALELVSGYDIVIDGTDNFTSKFLINDACWFAKKPLIFGSIYQFEGQVSVFNQAHGAERGPNYRDLLPSPPPPHLAPNCSQAGVIGVVPGIIGCLQASEAIKLVSGIGNTLSGKLLTFDALSCSMSLLTLRKKKSNPLSGANPTMFSLLPEPVYCAAPQDCPTVSAEELLTLGHTQEVLLLDVRESHERTLASLGGMHIPLDELAERIEEVKNTGAQTVVAYCHSGLRSAKACSILSDLLPLAALSLKDGIKPLIQKPKTMASILLAFKPHD